MSLRSFALRKKQEVLQAMGRADATVDDLFLEKLQRFQQLEQLCQTVQRDTQIYFDSLISASQASLALSEDFRHLYEGERNAMAIATIKYQESARTYDEQVTTMAKKFNLKIMDPARSFLKSFPPLKARVEERKKLLLEYDGLRNQEPAAVQRLEQEMDPDRRRKRQQALDDLQVKTEAARAAYEEANRQLHLDLPRQWEQRTRVFDPAFAELVTTILSTHLTAAASLKELLRYMETDGSFPETAVPAARLLSDEYEYATATKRDSSGSAVAADPLEPVDGKGISRTKPLRGGGGKADPLAKWQPRSQERTASVGAGTSPDAILIDEEASPAALPFLMSGGGGGTVKAAAVAQWLKETTPSTGDGTPADLLGGDDVRVAPRDLLGEDLPDEDEGSESEDDVWIVSQRRKEEYRAYFDRADEDKTGFVSGAQAKVLFSRSQLSTDALARIWDLADIDGDNLLSRREFAIALHLINTQLNQSTPLPEKLPTRLLVSLESE